MDNSEIYTDTSLNQNQSLQVVNLPYSVYQSELGRYYIGHSPFLTLRPNSNAWFGLLNPRNSGANLFVDMFTVTNNSNAICNSRCWFNSSPLGRFLESGNVSLVNSSVDPIPRSNAILAYAQDIPGVPFDGVSLFSQISTAFSTTPIILDGKLIVGPGSTCILFNQTNQRGGGSVEIGCRWWEEPI